MRDTGASPIRCAWRVRPWRPALVRIGGLSSPSRWRRGTGATRTPRTPRTPARRSGMRASGASERTHRVIPAPVAEARRRSVERCPLWGVRGRRSRQPRDTRRYARNAAHQAIGPGEYPEARAKVSGRPQGMEDDPGRGGNPGAREGRPQGMETIPGAGWQRRAEVVRGICEVTSADDHTAEGQRRRGAEAQRVRGAEAQRGKRQGAEGERHDLTTGRGQRERHWVEPPGGANERGTGSPMFNRQPLAGG